MFPTLAVKLKQLRLPGRRAESHDPNDNGGSRREGGGEGGSLKLAAERDS